uniref:Uncharacterized protein n=1 Tax=Romanomermis culicivorax TaxID=13658 RepID=A0A915JI75_ROMCU
MALSAFDSFLLPFNDEKFFKPGKYRQSCHLLQIQLTCCLNARQERRCWTLRMMIGRMFSTDSKKIFIVDIPLFN